MKKLLFFLLLVGAALAGIAVWSRYPRAYALSEQKLQFTHLQVGTLRESVSATGRVEPREIIAVTSEVPGTVIALSGKINDLVEEGTVLARLDDHSLQLDLESAQSGVDAARASLMQAQALRKAAQLALKYQIDIEKKGGFRSEREQTEVKLEASNAGVVVAESQLQATEALLKKAKEALEKTFIKAPGHCKSPSVAPGAACQRFLILERQVRLGQYVGPQGPPLFLVTRDIDHVEVHAQVAEADIPRVKPGLRTAFTVQGYTDEDVAFDGVVRDIRPMAINTKGAVYFDAIIDVANKKDPHSNEWRLRPGMTASVDLIRREHKNVWRIPASALNFHLDEAYWSEAARERIHAWQMRSDANEWQALWTWDSTRSQAVPVFVRLGGVNKQGEPGLKEGEFNEILEWEPGKEPNPGESFRIIIGAPAAHAPGIFEQPWNIKIS